ncbi:hypothetical protein GIB67_041129 [Kingdonia uniflora]|uniref:Protein kinase domain-containing protein n=1 Tax=Kingdonia uniflora TaxID=39325 RepID=A0A7J7LK64_9MAGN|nr:hypothetical protein GIB67_041129 [Kingdonia uniflora]
MGCFTVLKSKKKKSERAIHINRIKPQESTPTVLPEPQIQTQGRSLQSAPSSFKMSAKPVQLVKQVSTNRIRALSAPSSLSVAERDALALSEYDDTPSPQPLPLPSPSSGIMLKNMGSFKAGAFSGPLFASGPLPLPPLGGLRSFSYEEIAAACQHFSPDRCMSEGLSSVLYRASFGDDTSGSKKLEASVTRLLPSTQAMYNEFSTSNIQIDKEFSGKLSGYGCVSHNPEAEILSTSPAVANLSAETLEKGLLTPKSNVWCFGVVLLELLTGRKNLDNRHPKEERNLVRWSRPYLADDCRLSLIMDPRLKGRFHAKAARTVADIALKCLQKDPSERPTMRSIVESLENIQDLRYSCRFPLQEPSTIAGKSMSRSPSLNGIIIPAHRSSFSNSSPSRTRPPISPSRRPSIRLSPPPLSCSSAIIFEEKLGQERRKSASSRVLNC